MHMRGGAMGHSEERAPLALIPSWAPLLLGSRSGPILRGP